MSTIKSSSEHLTLNADGASKDIKFQSNGVEKASISSAGAFTSTTIDATVLTGALPAIDGSSLTGMSGGLYASVAIICDQKAYNTEGGTATSGAWRTRDLNTEVSDADGIVSISSNQFTLAAGTYTIEWSAPVYKTDRHSTRLYNISDSSVEQYGTSEWSWNSDYTITRSTGMDIVTIGGSKIFEIQYRSESTATNGLGRSQGSDASAVSIYTIVKIYKHS